MLPQSESPPPQAHHLAEHKRLPSPLPSSNSTPEQPLKSPTSTLSALYFHLRTRHSHRLTLFLTLLLLQLILILSTGSLPTFRLRHIILRRGVSDSVLWSFGARRPSSQCTATDLFYVYDLPPTFNYDILNDCDELYPWSSRCTALSNAGFGPSADKDLAGVVPDSLLSSWYVTDQFAADIIFHRRALAHPCRTADPDSAAAFYVPFYAGLAVGRRLWSRNITDTDRDCTLFLRWIEDQPLWKRTQGHYHFMTLGRITWDFRRTNGNWGSRFLYMHGMQNVTRLLIERDPWDLNDVGIPYPTSFHPRNAAEVRQWQEFLLNRNRSTLFSFAGAVRTGQKDDFRALLLDECQRESANGVCRSVNCANDRCNRSADTMSLFLDSKFCLQPRGDSYTRRSMFDCMLAGAVPVLFWQRSSHEQYQWHLPSGDEEEEREWSVFIDRKEIRNGTVSVKELLERIGEEKARRMREKVVELIPRMIYAAGEEGLGEGIKDAFDLTVEGILRRFGDRRLQEAIKEEGIVNANITVV